MNTPYVFKKCSKCGEWLVACKVNFHKNKTCKYGLKSICKKCTTEYGKKYNKDNKDKRRERNKQWRENNRDKIAEYGKQYRENNRDKIAERHKQYYEINRYKKLEQYKQYHKNNRDKIAERQKQYREENKDKIAEQHKQWREDNRDKTRKYDKQYRENNRDKIAERHKQYQATPQGQVVRFNGHCRRRIREQNQGNGITKEQWLEMMQYFDWKCAYSGEYIGGNNKRNIRSIDHIKPLNRGGEHEIWNLVPMYKPYNSSKRDNDLLEWYKEQDFFSEERLQKIYEWQEYAYKKWGNKDKVI